MNIIKSAGELPKKKKMGIRYRRPVVSLVIPAYNEESIIEKNLIEICNYMKKLETKYSWEVIVVNDGSSDKTGEILDNVTKHRSNIYVIHHIANMRLAQALKSAFESCKGDYVITLDADLSYSTDHIEKLLSKITETKAQVVIASPYMGEGTVSNVPKMRKLLSRWANKFLSFLAKGNIHTLTSMVRAYDRKFLCALDLKADDIDINAEIIYKTMLLRGRIIEIPAHLNWNHKNLNNDQRRSRIKILPIISRYFISGFIFRPFMFFTIPGSILLILSIYTNIWIIIHIITAYFEVPHTTGFFDTITSVAVAAAFQKAPHAFIIGGISLIVAFQLISLGVISYQSKRYFEELFHLITNIYKNYLER